MGVFGLAAGSNSDDLMGKKSCEGWNILERASLSYEAVKDSVLAVVDDPARVTSLLRVGRTRMTSDLFHLGLRENTSQQCFYFSSMQETHLEPDLVLQFVAVGQLSDLADDLVSMREAA